MLLKTKILLAFVTASALLGAGLWCGIKIRALNQANAQLNEELMSAKLEIGKAHTQFGEAQNKISLLEKQLKDEIKAHNELISKYGELLAQYNAIGGGTVNPQPPVNPDLPITVDTPLFKPGKIYVAQTEYVLQSFALPIVFKLIDDRLNISTSILTAPKYDYSYYLMADVKYELHLKIMAQMVETITEDGAVNNYANIFELDKDGNKVGKFELTSFEVVVEDYRKAKFHLWNPKLDVGLVAGFNGSLMYGGDIGISLSSYGLSKNDLTWRFARFSATLSNQGVGLAFCPMVWNAADPLPLVQNLWIGPQIYLNPNTRLVGFGAALNVSM